MKVIAFPFAGGNKHSFDFLKNILSRAGISLVVIEYPGRGTRFSEGLRTSLEDIVNDAAVQLDKVIDKGEYLVYGHSMGALVGYLICRHLESNALRKPKKLIVSGRQSPSCKGRQEKWSDLPCQEFWKKIEDLGGLPDELIKAKELRDFFEPTLRADIGALENYNYTPDGSLTIPIDVFYGSEEGFKDYSEIGKWQEMTSRPTTVYEKQGGHFFIYKHADSIGRHILREFI
jgi:external thioesterase TEII